MFCVHEKSQIQASDRSQPVLPMMPGVPQRMTSDYVRAGTTTLFAALDVASGKVIGSLHRRHRADEFKKFLMTLDKQTPPGLDLHLVLDNYATHKTLAIKAWLLAHPRFHLHFTPTGSSWLNLVERWFAELTNKQIRRGVHKSIQALEKDIRSWIAQWNTDPKPYVWTKTADEILERLASYLNRIPASEHSKRRRSFRVGGAGRPQIQGRDRALSWAVARAVAASISVGSVVGFEPGPGAFEEHAEFDVGVGGTDVFDDLLPAAHVAGDLHGRSPGLGTHLPDERHPPSLRPSC